MSYLASTTLIIEFVQCFEQENLEKMRTILAPNLVSYITNSEGGSDKVEGSEAFIRRVKAMNIPSVNFSLTITQMVEVAPQLVMVMLEVHANRGADRLHNFATFLIRIKNQQISETWMVEALPKRSDEFWKGTNES